MIVTELGLIVGGIILILCALAIWAASGLEHPDDDDFGEGW